MATQIQTEIEKKHVFNGRLGKEILVKVQNDIGVLATLAKTVAEKGISLDAGSSWVEGDNGYIRLVTSDNLRAREALIKKGFELDEKPVIMAELPNKPGMLKHLAEQLRRQDIDITHLYATALPGDTNCLIVFSTTDNDRALVGMQGSSQ